MFEIFFDMLQCRTQMQDAPVQASLLKCCASEFFLDSCDSAPDDFLLTTVPVQL